MRLYRVFAHRANARRGAPGYATYVYPRQTAGRWDNADRYQLVYGSATPEGAIAESFGRIPEWSDDMFEVPYLPDARSALATFEFDGDMQPIDLDDAQNLLERELRPTQVVIRNAAFTQSLALRLYQEQDLEAGRRWAGIRWWSFWAPHWPVYAIWISPGEHYPLRLEKVETLTLDHPAVQDAAATIIRTFS